MIFKSLLTLLSITYLCIQPNYIADASKPTWEPEHAPGIKVVNFASHDLPKIIIGARWVDLFNGMQFDDHLKDTPDELRPPSLVVFYGHKSCPKALNDINFEYNSENTLPAQERLSIFRYNIDAAPVRAWYKFTPEMDLQKRFGVTQCPTIVFVPRKCNGRTEWCTKPATDPLLQGLTVVGCENFKDQCTGFQLYDKTKHGEDWAKWILGEIEKEGEPQISPFLRTYEEQGLWLRRRQDTTVNNHERNIYLVEAFPAFTATGFKAMETPKPVQDWFIDVWNRRQKLRRLEAWHGDATQVSFHETPTTFIDMLTERYEKEKITNNYMKPIVEEWSGVAPLELTSFYGIREYHEGSILAPHIDRIETHVLSVTFSIAKLDPQTMKIIEDTSKLAPWPLEVTTYNGEIVRYDHLAGTMVLYESSKLIHGRPAPNPPGSVHVSAFLHYKPQHMHGREATQWDKITKNANANVRAFIASQMYKSKPTVEPKNPVFSKKSYGANTIWQHLNENDNNAAVEQEQLPVTFVNKSDRPLDIVWNGGVEHGLVRQGKLSPGMSFQIHSYPFHKFFWAEVGSDEPLPGGSFQIDAGKSVYTYSINKKETS